MRRKSLRWMVWAVELLVFAAAVVAAFLLRFDFYVPRVEDAHLKYAIVIWTLSKMIAFRALDLDRGWWRFVSIADVSMIALGNVAGSAAGGVLIYALAPAGFPRSIYFLDFLICLLATATLRMLPRILVDAVAQNRKGGQQVLIYGAGMAGVTLLREIRANASLNYRVCGFIDDDIQKQSIKIQGVPVLSPDNGLKSFITRRNIEQILIALPSATGAEMTEILRRCGDLGLRCRTIPALGELIQSRGLASQIREVAVEDLLGRSPIHLEEGLISDQLRDKVVMVTGAAGSIGSEICRQVARFNPRAIIGFENAETALFHLQREMTAHCSGIPFHPEIGSIQNEQRVRDVIGRHSPSIIYHAAAYKHVPMMEESVFEAVENNVFGTYTIAMAARKQGVRDFVMISSDKAVRPTSIMGVTKRVAELVIHALQSDRTNFVSVRFGNVLGSNGSVVPIFKQQIAAGGPVIVTHPEMRRYFMTIPEAVQLVLQASTIGKSGEIFVLDMGQPVRIVDLARNLILLSGLRPGEDIRIEFGGMRPGEKLCEELHALHENTVPTSYDKIKVFVGRGATWAAAKLSVGITRYLR